MGCLLANPWTEEGRSKNARCIGRSVCSLAFLPRLATPDVWLKCLGPFAHGLGNLGPTERKWVHRMRRNEQDGAGEGET